MAIDPSSPAGILFALSLWAFQQTLLSSAVIWFRARRNREYLVRKGIMSVEATRMIDLDVILYTVLWLISLQLIYVVVRSMPYLGATEIALTIILGVTVARIPMTQLKTLRANIRLPVVSYKKKLYNLTTPLAMLITGLLLVSLSLLLA